MSIPNNLNSPGEEFTRNKNRGDGRKSLTQAVGWLLLLPVTAGSVLTAKLNPSDHGISSDIKTSAGRDGANYALGQMLSNSLWPTQSRKNVKDVQNKAIIALDITKEFREGNKEDIDYAISAVNKASNAISEKGKSFGRAASLNVCVAKRDGAIWNIYEGINKQEISPDDKKELLNQVYKKTGSKRPDLFIKANEPLLIQKAKAGLLQDEEIIGINTVAATNVRTGNLSDRSRKSVNTQRFSINKAIFDAIPAPNKESPELLLTNLYLLDGLQRSASVKKDISNPRRSRKELSRIEKDVSASTITILNNSSEQLSTYAQQKNLTQEHVREFNTNIKASKKIISSTIELGQNKKLYKKICKKQLEANTSILKDMFSPDGITTDEQKKTATELFKGIAKAHSDISSIEKRSFIGQIMTSITRGSRRSDVLDTYKMIAKEAPDLVKPLSRIAEINELFTGRKGRRVAREMATYIYKGQQAKPEVSLAPEPDAIGTTTIPKQPKVKKAENNQYDELNAAAKSAVNSTLDDVFYDANEQPYDPYAQQSPSPSPKVNSAGQESGRS